MLSKILLALSLFVFGLLLLVPHAPFLFSDKEATCRVLGTHVRGGSAFGRDDVLVAVQSKQEVVGIFTFKDDNFTHVPGEKHPCLTLGGIPYEFYGRSTDLFDPTLLAIVAGYGILFVMLGLSLCFVPRATYREKMRLGRAALMGFGFAMFILSLSCGLALGLAESSTSATVAHVEPRGVSRGRVVLFHLGCPAAEFRVPAKDLDKFVPWMPTSMRVTLDCKIGDVVHPDRVYDYFPTFSAVWWAIVGAVFGLFVVIAVTIHYSEERYAAYLERSGQRYQHPTREDEKRAPPAPSRHGARPPIRKPAPPARRAPATATAYDDGGDDLIPLVGLYAAAQMMDGSGYVESGHAVDHGHSDYGHADYGHSGGDFGGHDVGGDAGGTWDH